MNPGAFSNEPKTIAKRRIELCRGSLAPCSEPAKAEDRKSNQMQVPKVKRTAALVSKNARSERIIAEV